MLPSYITESHDAQHQTLITRRGEAFVPGSLGQNNSRQCHNCMVLRTYREMLF
jgi:hypothetical protein